MQSNQKLSKILHMNQMNQNLPQVTEKDKKQDILNAYYALVDQLNTTVDKDSGAKLTQTADDVKSILKIQTDTLNQILNKKIDDVFNQLDNIAVSLSKLYDVKEQESIKLNREKENIHNAWKREQEEYSYQTARKRQIETDDWEQEKQKREEEIAQKEQKINEAGQELAELREKDKTFEERLNKSVNDAVNSATQRLQAEFAHKEELTNSQNDATKRLLEAKVESFANQVSAYKIEIERLNKQIDSANQRLTEIASGAVRNYRVQSSTPDLAKTQ